MYIYFSIIPIMCCCCSYAWLCIRTVQDSRVAGRNVPGEEQSAQETFLRSQHDLARSRPSLRGSYLILSNRIVRSVLCFNMRIKISSWGIRHVFSRPFLRGRPRYPPSITAFLESSKQKPKLFFSGPFMSQLTAAERGHDWSTVCVKCIWESRGIVDPVNHSQRVR